MRRRRARLGRGRRPHLRPLARRVGRRPRPRTCRTTVVWPAATIARTIRTTRATTTRVGAERERPGHIRLDPERRPEPVRQHPGVTVSPPPTAGGGGGGGTGGAAPAACRDTIAPVSRSPGGHEARTAAVSTSPALAPTRAARGQRHHGRGKGPQGVGVGSEGARQGQGQELQLPHEVRQAHGYRWCRRPVLCARGPRVADHAEAPRLARGQVSGGRARRRPAKNKEKPTKGRNIRASRARPARAFRKRRRRAVGGLTRGSRRPGRAAPRRTRCRVPAPDPDVVGPVCATRAALCAPESARATCSSYFAIGREASGGSRQPRRSPAIDTSRRGRAS